MYRRSLVIHQAEFPRACNVTCEPFPVLGPPPRPELVEHDEIEVQPYSGVIGSTVEAQKRMWTPKAVVNEFLLRAGGTDQLVSQQSARMAAESNESDQMS